MKFVRLRLAAIAAALCGSIVAGCGSGDGSGGAADLSLNVTPQEILVGQQSAISIGLDDINDNGVTLKVMMPSALEYVGGSGILGFKGRNTPFEPAAVTKLGADTYLVFQLPDALLRNSRSADVSFLVEGKARIEDGSVEVDADEFDAGFNPLNPGFDSQIGESIQVGRDAP